MSLSQDVHLAVGCKDGSFSFINTVSASVRKATSDDESAITALTIVEVERLVLVSII